MGSDTYFLSPFVPALSCARNTATDNWQVYKGSSIFYLSYHSAYILIYSFGLNLLILLYYKGSKENHQLSYFNTGNEVIHIPVIFILIIIRCYQQAFFLGNISATYITSSFLIDDRQNHQENWNSSSLVSELLVVLAGKACGSSSTIFLKLLLLTVWPDTKCCRSKDMRWSLELKTVNYNINGSLN